MFLVFIHSKHLNWYSGLKDYLKLYLSNRFNIDTQHRTPPLNIARSLHIFHLILSYIESITQGQSAMRLWIQGQSILLRLTCRGDSSKALDPSSLSSNLTFTRLRNTRKWLSLGQHVLSLYANAMFRWLYEGPSARPIRFRGIGPCLMRVFWILYI